MQKKHYYSFYRSKLIYPGKITRHLTRASLSVPLGKTLLLLAVAVFYAATALSQDAKTITGRVLDAGSGEPLPGVTVLIKGTTIGTATSIDGNYTLQVPGEYNTLVFSYVGFMTEEAVINNRSEVNMSMVPDVTSLDELVVVGYGVQKKVNLTGAVSTVSSEVMTARPVGQASSALQGVAPGVTVTQSSGQPGDDAGTIRIRGIGTLNDSNPLVLIDGVEGSLNHINPNVIASISVLKDAASASIYGSRAANGVILVTTKRAEEGRLSITYNGSGGWQRATNLPDMVGAVDHMLLTNEAYVNTGRDPLYPDDLIENYRNEGAANPDLYPDTDWQEEVLIGSGFMQNHFVSLNGGGENIRFLTSFGYFGQKGIIKTSDFNRFTIRNNADVRFSDKLTMKFDIRLLSEKTKEPGRSTSSVFHWMNRIPANQPGIHSNGTWGVGWNGANPIAFSQEGGDRTDKRRSAQLNASLNYQPVEWLEAQITFAPRFAEYTYDKFYGAIQTYHPDGTPAAKSPAKSELTRESSESFYNTLRGTLTFDKGFGNHNIKVMAGASREDYENDYFSAFRDVFILPEYPVLNTGSADNQQNAGNAAEWALQSFFGRINYNYKQKYLLEVNGRYDGSSRFSGGNKYGFFPSVSAGWRISEEPFMEPVKNVISELKFRGSWGRLGNQNIGNYPFTSSVVMGAYTFNKEIVNIAALNTLANPEISWETTEMTDFGFDMTLFSSLTLTGDYYFRQTRDILYKLNIPLTVGLSEPYQNVGVVNNEGWELGIAYQGNINEFNYDVRFNISDVKNEVVDLRGVKRDGLTVNHEGYPINSIYGLEAIGFFQSDDEVAAHAEQFGNVKAGDIKYKDQNKDGIINEDDNVIIGSTIPRYTFGTTLNASYKGFDLSVFFQGVAKADGYLYHQGIMPFYNGGTVQEQHKDHWTPENRDAAFPRLTISEANNEKNSSFWLKDAAYLRLKNLQVGYKVPARVTERFGIKYLRLYVNGQNLFTLDNFWDGYDVEAPVSRGDVYPQVKVYSFGVDVNF